jgi:PAS domain S-box-containing protein
MDTSDRVRTRPTPRDVERKFLIQEMFFSTTDGKGVITSGNDVFVRVSGYSHERLMGAPHKIIRHPDMPRVVFRLLWDQIQAGRWIGAYVKNMAADGAYYWVFAVVTPIEGGYLSIRLKPSSPFFNAVRDLYPELLRIEEEAEEKGQERGKAMTLAGKRLVETLAKLGFRDYDHFMNEALLAEVGSRKVLVGAAKSVVGAKERRAGLHGHCDVLTAQMTELYGNVESFLAVEKALAEQLPFVRGLGRALQLLSINAQLRAAGLRQEGLPLQVVAEQMAASARAVSDSTEDICAYMEKTTGALRDAAARISCSDLSVEMMRTFLAEMSAKEDSGQSAGLRKQVSQLAEVVEKNLSATCELAGAVADQMRTLELRLGDFLKAIRTLEILHVTGKVQAVQCADGERVATVFHEVSTKTGEARTRLSELAELSTNVTIKLPDRRTMDASLGAMRRAA